MSTVENSGLRCKLGPAYHRLTQKQNTFFDSDCVGTGGGDISFYTGTDMYTYQTQYYLDFKRMNFATILNKQKISNKHFSVKAQIAKANKDEVPFLMILTYLGWEYKDKPMYFVIPMNKYARQLAFQTKKDSAGFWLTLRQYSQFIAFIKKINWDKNEEIDIKVRWTENCHLSDNKSFCQNDLPNQYIEYDLPEMEMIQFDQYELQQLGEI